jgi:hypothetical protein
MLKKFLFITCLLVASHSANASLITHSGYTRAEASDIVSGNGLEWLMWDQTANMSISQALEAYTAQGWRLASNLDMAVLFNAFQFGKTDWSGAENLGQVAYTPWQLSEVSSHNAFTLLFGSTFNSALCDGPYPLSWCDGYATNDPLILAQAYYGSDDDQDGFYKSALVYDDFSYALQNNNDKVDGYAVLRAASWSPDAQSLSYGVALVRSATAVAVPAPASFALFIIALMLLAFLRRSTLGGNNSLLSNKAKVEL